MVPCDFFPRAGLGARYPPVIYGLIVGRGGLRSRAENTTPPCKYYTPIHCLVRPLHRRWHRVGLESVAHSTDSQHEQNPNVAPPKWYRRTSLAAVYGDVCLGWDWLPDLSRHSPNGVRCAVPVPLSEWRHSLDPVPPSQGTSC